MNISVVSIKQHRDKYNPVDIRFKITSQNSLHMTANRFSTITGIYFVCIIQNKEYR